MRIDVENGKYTFVVENGEVSLLRHGEPWLRIWVAVKAIIALMGELEEAREEAKFWRLTAERYSEGK